MNLITNNISTLKIHKMTQAQYERELAAGNIDENALYLTPDEDRDLSLYLMKDEAKKEYESQSEAKEKLDEAKEYAETVILAVTKEMGESKADKEHSHDEMYYTENEVDALIAGIHNDIFWVTVTQNGDGTYSADKTCAEIIEARDSGKFPVAQYGNLVYTLQSSGEGSIGADCQFRRTFAGRNQVSTDMIIITGTGFVNVGTRTFNMNQIANVLNVTELTTTNKTITGAINELDAEVNALIEGASNSEVFVITVTKSEDNKYSADKTYEEIYNAYINGKELSVRYDNGEYEAVYQLLSYDETDLLTGFTFKNISVSTIGAKSDAFILTSKSYVMHGSGDFTQERIATVNTNATLTTTNKTLVGAINEINEKVNQDSSAIPAPATATVGQTIAVKAVDENGKPTEWEAVDFTGGGGTSAGNENWELINTVSIAEADGVDKIAISTDNNGNPFELRELAVIAKNVVHAQGYAYASVRINDKNVGESRHRPNVFIHIKRKADIWVAEYCSWGYESTCPTTYGFGHAGYIHRSNEIPTINKLSMTYSAGELEIWGVRK